MLGGYAPHTHNPRDFSVLLRSDEIDTHFLNASHAQHVHSHAWHTLDITLPLQTSAHTEVSVIF